MPNGGSIAPVHVGYDIVFNPMKTAFFYGMVPSCYVEATLGAIPPYVKVAAACDVDYWGLGIGVETGCITWNNKYGSQQSRLLRPTVYASVKLRLLDAAFRLPGRHN